MSTFTSSKKKKNKLKQIVIREKTTRPGYSFGYQLPPVNKSKDLEEFPGPANYRMTKNTWDKRTTKK